MPKGYEGRFGWFELLWFDLIAERAQPNSSPALDSKPHLADDLLRKLYTKAPLNLGLWRA